jgi:peptidoglycan/xylan/chitin deacetylase (PgdA/CDA1 family)
VYYPFAAVNDQALKYKNIIRNKWSVAILDYALGRLLNQQKIELPYHPDKRKASLSKFFENHHRKENTFLRELKCAIWFCPF